MRKLAAAAAATLLLIAACSSEDPEAATPPPPEEAAELPEELPEPDIADLPEVVAEVDGVQITREEFLDIYEPEFQQVAAASQASGQELDQDELKRQIADVLVDTELMLMEAAERSIEPTEEQVEDAATELAEDWQLGSADELFTMLEEQGLDPDAAAVAGRIRNAGAIFVGPYSPVPLGDYLAGSNHVLPTGGTARFASGLSVMAFLKPVQVIEYDDAALRKVAEPLRALAVSEDLPAHADAVDIRLD